MSTIRQLLLPCISTLVMFSCVSKNQDTREQEFNVVEITDQQYSSDSMQIGKMEKRVFENTVKCNGTLIPFPEGMAKISAPFGGIVKKIYCRNGQFIEKNQTLLEITGNEIIDIQNDFAEASANYKRFKSEYERIKSLYDEKVASEKDFIYAQTEYRASVAKYNGLKLKIELIGFSAESIENGEINAFYSIKSPIGGFVSKLKTVIGSYVDSQSELLEIINPDLFQIKLTVFAKDLKGIKIGQSVRFKSADNQEVHLATLSSVGVVIDDETKSVDCYASIKDEGQLNPVSNEFIEAEIITRTDTVNALPSEAIIKNENDYFVLVLNKQEDSKYFFNKIQVKTGRQFEGFTEIIEPEIQGLILTRGVYNISL